MNRRITAWFFVVVMLVGVGGCSQSNSGDPQESPVGTSDTDRFWVFPNPNKDPATGVYQNNDAAYAQAYYAEIDPLSERDTLAKFKAKNGFGTPTPAGVEEVQVIFRDVRDLGYGRRMTVRFTDPSHGSYTPTSHKVAVFVENYQVVPFAGDDYTGLNLDAALMPDPRWHVGTNAIEYEVDAITERPITRFYTFAPDGARLNTANLDGRGQKAMPSLCINCHGGRADPLYIDRFGAPTVRFPDGGNVRARLQPIKVDSVAFASNGPYARVNQEESLRQINYAIFCAHSLEFGATPSGPDTCRPRQGKGDGSTGGHDYQGAEAEMIKSWYSAGAIDTPGTAMADGYLPTGLGGIAGWADTSVDTRLTNPISLAQQQALYNNVVAPYCRVCHALRGTENQSDIDFSSYLKFEGFADRIREHVFVRGNMPLGLIIYNDFWESTAPEQLADWLVSVGQTNPVRVGGGTIGQPVQPSGTLADPSFLPMGVSNTPDYNVGLPNAPFPFTKPTTFANIKAIIQNANTVGCTGCHVTPTLALPTVGVGNAYYPPIAYDDVDRDRSGSYVPAVDDYEFYKALRGRVNLTDFAGSPLLRRPTTLHHGAGYVVLDQASVTLCADPPGFPQCKPFSDFGGYAQAVRDTFLDWIEHGAPYSYTGSTPNY